MLACPSCAHENPDEQKFCGECGSKLEATPVREERKVITALFCDLVGSTALGEQLDAEDISRLLRDYQRICRARIESHGGVVEKFIGDAVVGVFGVPLAHEDDPERAVRAALRITEDIGASDLFIEVRIGVNTGEALVRLDVDPRSGEGFATGDTMNTAARLEAAAPVMGVAVGVGTYQASAETIVYEELPAITAKGKSEPVPTWRALHPASRVVGNEERDRSPFVGRGLELSMLTQLFDRSRSRPATEFVTIIAEPGLGKSRLVRELARHVDQLKEFVVWREGRCLPYGDGISFWPLGEIVKAQAGILETDDQGTISSRLDRTVTAADEQTRSWIKDRLAPLVGMETDTAPPEREEVFTAWRRFLEQIAASNPTVLVIEDLHWADAAFVAFLEHLAERTAGLPLLVVVTARPEIEERHPSWPPGRRSTVLTLSPLTDGDVESLIIQSLPSDDPRLIAIVLDRAGGSPLYAEQLAAMLNENLLPIAGGALDETLIPSSVQALIAARIDALPPETKGVLMEASVIGKTFWKGAIASIGEHNDLETTLGELVRREFCRPVQPSSMEGDLEFGFWHSLVRDVAYAELTKAERARIHAATARWIVDRTDSAMGEDAEIVVHHLDAAFELAPAEPEFETAGLIELLAEALLVAGEAAFRTDAGEADRLLGRAVGLFEEKSPSYLRAITLRAKSLKMADHALEAIPLLETAVKRLQRESRLDDAADLVVLLSEAYWETGDQEKVYDCVRAFLSELDPAPSSAKVVALAQLAFLAWADGEDDEAQSICDDALRIDEEIGLEPHLDLLIIRGLMRVQQGDLDGEREVREGIKLSLERGEPSRAAVALWNLSVPFEGWLGAEGMRKSGDEAIQLCEQRGLGYVTPFRAMRLLSRIEVGEWDMLAEAPTLAKVSRDRGNRSSESFALLATGYVELQCFGTLSEVSRLVELAEAWDPSLAWFGGAVLSRSSESGGREKGLQVLRHLAETEVQPEYMFEAIDAAIRAGALDLAQQLAPDPAAFQMPGKLADAHAAAGAFIEVGGRWDEAATNYVQAVGRWRELGYPWNAVGPLVGLGRCLLKLGRSKDSLAKLHEAKHICEPLRAAARIAEIDQLLAIIPPDGGSA